MPTAESILVDPQPFFLPILRGFDIRDQDMITTSSRERVLVAGSAKIEKNIKTMESVGTPFARQIILNATILLIAFEVSI